MNRNTKLRIGIVVGIAVALAVAIGASGAIAVSRALSPSDESQAVIDDAAAELGVQPSELSDALRQALENRIDEALADGRITEEQAQRLKEALAGGELPLFGLGSHGLAGPGLGFGHFGKLDAAATYLGLTEAELHEQLRDGRALAEVAEAEGKSVSGLVDTLVAEAKSKLDEAVAEGRLTEERAAELEQGLEERMTDLVNGNLAFHGHGLGRGLRGHGESPFRGLRA